MALKAFPAFSGSKLSHHLLTDCHGKPMKVNKFLMCMVTSCNEYYHVQSLIHSIVMFIENVSGDSHLLVMHTVTLKAT